MKALLWKDYYMMRGSLKAVFVLVLVWSLIPQGFLNVFAVVYGAVLPFSLLTLDQRSRWDRYVRLLPYRDRDVVLNYYLVGWGVMALGAAAVTVFQGLMRGQSGSSFTVKTAALSFGAGLLMLAVNVPLMLRFGSERGRMVSMLTTCFACAVAGILGSLSGQGDAPEALPSVSRLMDAAAPAALALGLAATAVSLPLSLRFYRRGTP